MHEPDTEITPPSDGWPIPEGPTLLAPPPAAGPPPPDRRIGAGMMLALGAIVLAAIGIALAWYLTHRGSPSRTSAAVVRNEPLSNPAANQVAVPRVVGTTKDGRVPQRPQAATMPDVTGRPEAAAVQALNRAGILASLAWVPDGDELGTVVAQAKPSGTAVPSRSHVQINLSTGPGTKTAEPVPNVVGKSLQDALATINAAHLRMIYLKLPVSDRSQAGKVVQQSPLGGTAPKNAQIVVWLGVYGG
jgi:beta-lactam-binding protein with PASTA domain